MTGGLLQDARIVDIHKEQETSMNKNVLGFVHPRPMAGTDCQAVSGLFRRGTSDEQVPELLGPETVLLPGSHDAQIRAIPIHSKQVHSSYPGGAVFETTLNSRYI